MSRLARLPWIVIALAFLVEAWIWDHLGPWIRRAVEALPFQGLKAWIETRLKRLPPYGALAVFLLGGFVLAPFKFLEIWLVAHHHYYALVALFLALKTVGLGLTAFLFGALKPKLIEISWFVWIYDQVLRARAWAEIQVKPTMDWLRSLQKAALAHLPRGLALRRARRIRRRMARRRAPIAL